MYCARCGRSLRPGQTRYTVTIRVVADFDGVLEERAGGDEVEAIFREVEEKTEEELMREVVQELSFTLCKPCRDEWVFAPLGEAAAEADPAPGPLH